MIFSVIAIVDLTCPKTILIYQWQITIFNQTKMNLGPFISNKIWEKIKNKRNGKFMKI